MIDSYPTANCHGPVLLVSLFVCSMCFWDFVVSFVCFPPVCSSPVCFPSKPFWYLSNYPFPVPSVFYPITLTCDLCLTTPAPPTLVSLVCIKVQSIVQSFLSHMLCISV